jgi:uncharacterized protein YcnI
MSKMYQVFCIVLVGFFLLPIVVSSFAMVDLKPMIVAPDTIQDFQLSVPSRLDSPTIKIRLIVPEGVDQILPNANPLWKIDLVKDNDKITEIQWAGGYTPKDTREVLGFSAHTPNKEVELKWKLYQSFQDGTEKSFDQELNKSDAINTPFIITQIKNSATDNIKPVQAATNPTNSVLSVISILISGIALYFSQKKV